MKNKDTSKNTLVLPYLPDEGENANTVLSISKINE